MPKESATAKYQCFVDHRLDMQLKEGIRRTVCQDLPLDEPNCFYEGNPYCIFHFPGITKNIDAFKKEFDKKILLEDYDFQYVYFPISINLNVFGTISGVFKKSVNFSGATFSQITNFRFFRFEEKVSFADATFAQDTSFSDAVFMEAANFSGAHFDAKSETFFNKTKFFGEVSFQKATFEGVIRFEGEPDEDIFTGEKVLLDLGKANIEKPERIFFHTVRLEPGWFVNTDASKFVFTDCRWRYSDNRRVNLKTELENLKNRGFKNPHALLTKACWQLADNHEENKSFGDASLFRQLAQDSKRLETVWWKKPFTLHWWYWLSSFYGESWSRALLVSIILIFVIFPVFYTQTQYQVCPHGRPLVTSLNENSCITGGISFNETFVHSLTIATFQEVEHRRPLTIWGELLELLEQIFASLYAALLALAIRRKFMR